MVRYRAALISLGLLSACAATSRPLRPAGNLACFRDEDGPSRNAFFHEVLSAEPTRRTARFDDYTRDSYHIDKLDLARGLPDAARACGKKVTALIVVGPLGPLWSFHVATVIEEGSQVRVNSLVMPHARITGKGTGLAPAQEIADKLEALTSAPLVQPGVPPPDKRGDLPHTFLLARYDQDQPRYFYAVFNEFRGTPGMEELLDKVNAILSKTVTTTYEHGDAVE